MSKTIDTFQSSNQKPQDDSGHQGAWSSVWLFVWDFLKVFLIALAVIIPVRFFLFQPFIVTGLSMQPNFRDGEYLIIDEISYRFIEPKRGEVAVIHSPIDNSQYFIKRVIGLPGETVELSGGRITIINPDNPQGISLKETYIPPQVATFGSIKLTLSKDQYYVLGDNRLASSDSRSFGPIARSKIVGRVLLRAFPLNRFGAFSVPSYSY